MAKKLDAMEKEWQARSDVDALTRVEALKGDKPRLKTAQKLATQQAAEHQKAAKLAQQVARKPAPTRGARPPARRQGRSSRR